MCRLPLGQVKECSKTVLRMLNNVEVRCPHRTADAEEDNSREEGFEDGERPAKRAKSEREIVCSWEGNFGDLLSKHLGECSFQPVPCPRGCGKIVRRKDLALHEDECEKFTEKCSICCEAVKPGAMAAHMRDAAELHVHLLTEKLEEEKRRSSEQSSLKEVLDAVKSIPKSQQQHTTTITRQRTEDIKAEVRRQLNKSVVWKISRASRLFDKPKNWNLQSPKFFLHGLEYQLSFKPNGNKAGCSTLNLFAASGEQEKAMSVKMTFNNVCSEIDRDWKHGMVLAEWPPKKTIFDSCEDDLMVIELEVLKVSDIVQTTVA